VSVTHARSLASCHLRHVLNIKLEEEEVRLVLYLIIHTLSDCLPIVNNLEPNSPVVNVFIMGQQHQTN